jgi:hypothetical protein
VKDPGLGKVEIPALFSPCRGFKYHIKTKFGPWPEFADNTASRNLSDGLGLVFSREIFSKMIIGLFAKKPARPIKLLARLS